MAGRKAVRHPAGVECESPARDEPGVFQVISVRATSSAMGSDVDRPTDTNKNKNVCAPGLERGSGSDVWMESLGCREGVYGGRSFLLVTSMHARSERLSY